MRNTSTVSYRLVSDTAIEETIPFSVKARGYDPDQVNRYIHKLMSEYSNLQESYTDLQDRYDEQTGKPGANMEVIAKVLVDAEASAAKTIAEAKMLAEAEALKITAEAKAEALRIVAEAKAEASAITKKAQQELILIQSEKAQLLDSVNSTVSRLKTLGLTQSEPARKYISVSVS